MKDAFEISRGNLPLLTDVLTDETGTPVDLTGSGVQLILQSGALILTAAALVTNATGGAVQYQFVAPQTDVTGAYQGQWKVTDVSGGIRSFPTCPFNFEIVPALPLPPVTSFTKLESRPTAPRRQGSSDRRAARPHTRRARRRDSQRRGAWPTARAALQAQGRGRTRAPGPSP